MISITPSGSQTISVVNIAHDNFDAIFGFCPDLFDKPMLIFEADNFFDGFKTGNEIHRICPYTRRRTQTFE